MNLPNELVSLLFPENPPSVVELEERYPERELKANAIVTRFAPSPTGFMHIGGIYIAMLGKNLAHHSSGVYFIRIEDTDQKRKVEESQAHFDETFKYFDIQSDENDFNSKWGPYTQSKRSQIYLTYIKELLNNGRAYPCFCSKEKLEKQTAEQIANKEEIGYYGRWANCRNLGSDEVEERVRMREPFVIRFKAYGSNETIIFNDEIRGLIKAKDNINDVVILKSSLNELPLPTYHLAHAVDDHLMRVNLVLRSDEWISSVPLHFQLFDALGFERIKYAHIAPLMKQEGKSKRKLSKRKDPEASVTYYIEQGFPAKAVTIYLKGLANSKIATLPLEEVIEREIILKNLPNSGALLDIEKLKDVASNFVALLSAKEITEEVYNWSRRHDLPLSTIIKANWNFTIEIIDVDRFNNGRTRKDLYRWVDFQQLFGFFFKDLFKKVESLSDLRFENQSTIGAKELLTEFIKDYPEGADNAEWFDKVSKISARVGFAISSKDYKESPSSHHGTIKDATQILRIVITGRMSSPSLFEVCKILGRDMVIERIQPLLKTL